jgi:hypothetical protein
MIPRTNVASGFVDELTLFRNPSKLLQEIKREVVGEAPIELLQDKSILREFSAGYWGTERGTT